jgi:hypothetical protein
VEDSRVGKDMPSLPLGHRRGVLVALSLVRETVVTFQAVTPVTRARIATCWMR